MNLEEVGFRRSPLHLDDLAALVEVERRCFGSPWTIGQFRHELKVPFSKTTVVWDDSTHPRRVAAYVCRWAVGGEVSLLNLAVDPDYRKRGIARALVEEMVEEARSAGATLVTLEVREKNAAARALYASLGFEQSGLRRNYYGDGEHALVMTLKLAAEDRYREGLCPNSDTRV